MEFNEKMGIIDQLIDFWENKKNVTLVETVDEEPVEANVPEDEEPVEAHVPVDEEPVEAHVPVDEEPVEAHVPVEEEHVESLIPDVMEAHIPDDDEDFANVMLPPKTRQRGRPKGAVNRVIGLPKKRKCTEKGSNTRPKKVKLQMNQVVDKIQLTRIPGSEDWVCA